MKHEPNPSNIVRASAGSIEYLFIFFTFWVGIIQVLTGFWRVMTVMTDVLGSLPN